MKKIRGTVGERGGKIFRKRGIARGKGPRMTTVPRRADQEERIKSAHLREMANQENEVAKKNTSEATSSAMAGKKSFKQRKFGEKPVDSLNQQRR